MRTRRDLRSSPLRPEPGSVVARPVSACLLLALLVFLPVAARGQAFAGPLRTSEQNPLYRLLYAPETEPSDPVGEGALRFELSTSYSNILEASHRPSHSHLFDLEQMTNSLAMRYGWTTSLEVGARVGWYMGWGGFLDPFISGFHDFFGLPNGGRDHRPNGDYLVFLEHEELEGRSFPLATGERELSLEDVRVFAKWRIRGGARDASSLSLRAALRRTAGPVAPGRIDGALSLHGRLSRGSVVLHGSSGLTFPNPPRELKPLTAPRAAFFSGTFECGRWSALSLLAQVRGSTSYVRGFTGGELRGFPLNLGLGMGGLMAGGWGWQISFSEDLIPSGPAIDFTVDVEVSRQTVP